MNEKKPFWKTKKLKDRTLKMYEVPPFQLKKFLKLDKDLREWQHIFTVPDKGKNMHYFRMCFHPHVPKSTEEEVSLCVDCCRETNRIYKKTHKRDRHKPKVRGQLPKDSIGYADWGRIPDEWRSPENTLTIVERAVLGRIATVAVIDKCRAIYKGASTQVKLKGHTFCVPIESELLYNKIVENLHEYLHKVMSIVFVGDEEEWTAASKLNMLMSRYKVDVERYMRWNVILRRLNQPAFLPDVESEEDIALLKKNLEDVQRNLFRVLLADNGYSAAIDQKGYDVAKARPQEDDPDADADPGMRNVMLTGRPTENQPNLLILQALRSKLKDAEEQKAEMKEDGDDDDVDGDGDDDERDDNGDDGKDELDKLCGEKLNVLPGLVKDFDNVPYIFTNAFPSLFPLGVHEYHLGGLRNLTMKKRKQLFQFYDRRFQETPEFFFWVHNHLMRKAVCSRISIAARGKLSKEFGEFMNSPGLAKKLDLAMIDLRRAASGKHQIQPSTTTLVKTILRHINVIGSKIPWSPMERAGTLKEIYALTQSHGTSSYWITFSPSMAHSRLAMRIFYPDQEDFKEIVLKLPQECADMVNKNPFISARVFERYVKHVFDTLIGLPCHHHCKKSTFPGKGIFGTSYGHYGVVEAQGRGGGFIRNLKI